jgi:hypothetical protein
MVFGGQVYIYRFVEAKIVPPLCKTQEQGGGEVGEERAKTAHAHRKKTPGLESNEAFLLP